MRTTNPRNLERLDIAGLPATERQQAIAAAAGETLKVSRHKARQIEPSDAAERCHQCPFVSTAHDRGETMERHIQREHGGAGGSSLVL